MAMHSHVVAWTVAAAETGELSPKRSSRMLATVKASRATNL